MLQTPVVVGPFYLSHLTSIVPKKACQSTFPRQDVDQTHDANLGCCRAVVPLPFACYRSKEKAPQSTFLAKMSTKHQFPTSRSDMPSFPGNKPLCLADTCMFHLTRPLVICTPRMTKDAERYPQLTEKPSCFP